VKFFYFFLLITFSFFFSCENDIKTINKIAALRETNVEIVKDITTYYSDKGILKAQLKSPLVKEYVVKEPYKELPNGVEVTFFNAEKEEDGKLNARYGITYESKNLVVVRNDVVVINQKGEKLNTEELTWDTKQHILFTDKHVAITTGKEILYGDGMTAKEDFSEYKIKHLTGTVKVKNSL
jgi:LPS export ABC transporter protein LptC